MSVPMPRHRRIYLDFNATCPPSSAVAAAVSEALVRGGNPSSPYAEGRAARAILEDGRQRVADCLGAESLDLVFCSGGTEANHLGLAGLARAQRDRDPSRTRVLLPPAVHASLLAVGQGLEREGFAFESVAVDQYGRIDRSALHAQLASDTVAVLGFSLVGHELGSIEDVGALAEAARSHGCYLFCDAVQAFAKIPLDIAQLGVDGLSISAHKIGGPQGIGALWLRPGPDVQAIFGGGKQESSRRPGTQATGLVAGFAAALAEWDSLQANCQRLEPVSARLRAGLADLGGTLHSDADPSRSVASTISARFAGIAGDVLVASLDLAGIAISTGAACSSGMTTPSQGLLGMGLSEGQALEAIRVSMGPSTQADDIEALLEVLPNIIDRAQRFS